MGTAVMRFARREASWVAGGTSTLLAALWAWATGLDLDDLTLPGPELDHDDLWDAWR